MAELLQEQYVSVFSNLAAGKQRHDGCNAGPKIGDITFSQADIQEAIDDMNRADVEDHDIPALILKECKNNIFFFLMGDGLLKVQRMGTSPFHSPKEQHLLSCLSYMERIL